MKKINLKDFKNGLKREEMKSISGGITATVDATCKCGTNAPFNLPEGCNCNCMCEGYKC